MNFIFLVKEKFNFFMINTLNKNVIDFIKKIMQECVKLSKTLGKVIILICFTYLWVHIASHRYYPSDHMCEFLPEILSWLITDYEVNISIKDPTLATQIMHIK